MARKKIQRKMGGDIQKGLRDRKKSLIQIIIGPRQVGKTTAAHAIERTWNGPVIFASADEIGSTQATWIESQWERARLKHSKKKTALLILDEVQKVPSWSTSVKALWDEDRRSKTEIRVLLLGSSSLLIQQGLNETLAGRFILHRFPHWSFSECCSAFGFHLDQWLFFGGYPGAAIFYKDQEKWQNYITDSLIETAIARDILQMQNITKPALLRNLFHLATQHPAQILSYNKMLGQLQDAGNTTTLAHYLKLLGSAFLVSGLEAFRLGKDVKRGSSPKLIVWNNALINALGGRDFEQTRQDSELWGRIVENAVGAHLLNNLQSIRYKISYWRQSNHEVDFVVQKGSQIWAIEVKSGKKQRTSGLDEFKKIYPQAKPLIIGSSAFPLKEFFESSPTKIFG